MKENKNQSKIKQRLKNHRKDQYTKSWLFEKTNKLVNLQPNSSGKKKERERGLNDTKLDMKLEEVNS